MLDPKDGWEIVRFTVECDPEGEGWCRLRDIDVGECDCIGPTEEDVEYKEVDGVLYGRRPRVIDLDLDLHARRLAKWFKASRDRGDS